MVAAAAALRTSAPELGFVGWLGYPLAAGVAAGMAWGDHHWTSDILSGALLGEAIGGSVGRSFAPRVEGIALDDLQPTVSLIPQPGGGLLTCSGVW
jgi:membrane-associated phospholipid phosphatase